MWFGLCVRDLQKIPKLLSSSLCELQKDWIWLLSAADVYGIDIYGKGAWILSQVCTSRLRVAVDGHR